MPEHPKRLSYDADGQGTISVELLTFEGGTWSAAEIHQQSTRDVNGRQILSGYVVSQPGKHFRVLLSYSKGGKRGHWRLKDDLLCATHVDGRKVPVGEYTIRRGSYENPVDLIGPCVEEGSQHVRGLPILNVPREADQPFSWKAREPGYNMLTKLPPGCECVDDLSSLRFVLSTCKVKRVKRGRCAFPASEPSQQSSKQDRDFETRRLKHHELSEYIHVASSDSTEDGYDEIPDFDVSSQPFMEFRLYYKSRQLLQHLGILGQQLNLKPVSVRKGRPELANANKVQSLKRETTPVVAYKPASPPTTSKATLSQRKPFAGYYVPQHWLAEAGGVMGVRKCAMAGKARRQPPSASITKKRKAQGPPKAAEPAPKRRSPTPYAARTVPTPPPTPPPVPEPVAAPARVPHSPAVSDASSLPSISRMFAQQPARTAAPPAVAARQATPGPVPRVKQEERVSQPRRARASARSPSFVDLTMDSDEEEANQKAALVEAIAAQALVARTDADEQAPPAPGVPRLVPERIAAQDLLTELDIFDDGNVQALLDTGFKTKEKFLKNLPRLDNDDRAGILGDLRKDMGKIDYGIFCAWLKRSGIEL